MRKFLLTICIIFTSLLAGCVSQLHPYQPPIQQGNMLDEAAISQLHVGMTQEEVVQLLGTPILKDTFIPNQWTYIYSYRPSRGAYQQKQVTLFFSNAKLIRITN